MSYVQATTIALGIVFAASARALVAKAYDDLPLLLSSLVAYTLSAAAQYVKPAQAHRAHYLAAFSASTTLLLVAYRVVPLGSVIAQALQDKQEVLTDPFISARVSIANRDLPTHHGLV